MALAAIARSLITDIKENYWLENKPIISFTRILNVLGACGSHQGKCILFWTKRARTSHNMICVMLRLVYIPS